MRTVVRLVILHIGLLILMASLNNGGGVAGWWWGKKRAPPPPPPPPPPPVNYNNVPGYTHRHGDCHDETIKKLTFADRFRCASECNELSECNSYLWINKGKDSFCFLKNYICPRLFSTGNKDYHFYTKKNPIIEDTLDNNDDGWQDKKKK